MQKLIEYAEKYSQWVALGLGALWLLWMVYGSLLSPPVTVAIGPKDVGPGDVDEEIVKGPVKRLEDEMKLTNSPDMPIQPFAQKFADTMALKGVEAYALAEPFVDPKVAPIGGGRIGGEIDPTFDGVIPLIPPAQLVGTTMGRSTVQVPPPDWKPDPNNANNAQVQPVFMPDDRDWISVFFTVDLQAISAAFNEAELKDHARKTAFLEVTLIRQELQPDGTWGKEEVVRPLPISDIQPLPQKGNMMAERKFQEWAQRNTPQIINPPFFQVIDGDPWLKWGDKPAVNEAPVAPAIIPPVQPPKKDVQPKQPRQPRTPKQRDETPPGMPNNPGRKGSGRPGYAPVDSERPASAFDRQYQRAGTPPPMINPEGGARPPNFGGAGAMPGPGGQPRGNIDPGKAPDASFDPAGYGVWIIHAHDDTAQPGKTYRYRIDYKMKNPLFNVAAAAKDEADTKVFMIQPKLTKADIESQWTEAVTIPPRTLFFIAGTKPKADFPTATVEIFNWHRGEWHHKSMPVAPGDLIRWSERISVGVGAPSQLIDFSSGWTVVDIIQSKDLEYVLLIHDDGTLAKRDSRTDAGDQKFKDLKDLTEKAKAANAAAQR